MVAGPTIRVRVTNENSQYRGHYGTVINYDAPYYEVRLDGQLDKHTVPLLAKELQLSTQPCPVTYVTSTASYN